jgi:hypothetical protein
MSLDRQKPIISLEELSNLPLLEHEIFSKDQPENYENSELNLIKHRTIYIYGAGMPLSLIDCPRY